MTGDEFQKDFIDAWLKAARADDGQWLREVLGEPDAELESLVESMTTALECIEAFATEPDDPDWEPNFALKWQTYGERPSGGDCIAVRFHGDDHAVLFGEYDAFDEFALDDLVEDRSFERVMVEMPEGMEMEQMIDALGFVEDGLGLDGPPVWSDVRTALLWDQDGQYFEARLDGEPLG